MSGRVVQARFENTFADVLDADRSFRKIRASRWVDRGLGVFLGAVGVSAFSLWPVVSFVFLAAAVVTFFDLVRPVVLWARYRRAAGLRGTWELEAGEDDIRWKTADADSRMSWSAFTRLVESPRSFVLTLDTGMISYVPKRALTPADADLFRELALEGITARRSTLNA